jgi:hypothetical protein
MSQIQSGRSGAPFVPPKFGATGGTSNTNFIQNTLKEFKPQTNTRPSQDTFVSTAQQNPAFDPNVPTPAQRSSAASVLFGKTSFSSLPSPTAELPTTAPTPKPQQQGLATDGAIEHSSGSQSDDGQGSDQDQ